MPKLFRNKFILGLAIGFIIGLLLGSSIFIIGLSISPSTTRVDVSKYELKIENLRSIVKNLNIQINQLSEKDEEISSLKSKIEELKKSSDLTIILLPNKLYYVMAKRMIEKANRSIYIAVYAVKYDPKESIYEDPVSMLLKNLVDAERRGRHKSCRRRRHL